MFNKKKIVLAMGTLLVSASMLLAGCGGGGSQQAASSGGEKISGKISASGSTALLPLLKPAQEAFQDKYKDVTVNVAGGGSFTGMNQVAEGSVISATRMSTCRMNTRIRDSSTTRSSLSRLYSSSTRRTKWTTSRRIRSSAS